MSDSKIPTNPSPKYQRLLMEKAAYKRAKWGRIRNHAYMLIFLPLLLPIHLSLLVLLFILKERSHALIYRYLKFYFSIYFFFGGTHVLNVFPIPEAPPSKPTLFFTTRNTDLISCFLPKLFSFPVSVPFQPKLFKFPIHFFFPFIRMGSFISQLGYEDKPIDQSIHDIHKSLLNNIPTVVYINPGIITPTFNESLTLYSDILELMNSSVDCYFLACKGLEGVKAGTLFYPNFVSVCCVSADDLFEGSEKTHFPKQEKNLRIMKFFDYQAMTII